MSNLLIDIGNSSIKMAISERGVITKLFKCNEPYDMDYALFEAKSCGVEKIVVSNVAGTQEELFEKLKDISPNILNVNSSLNLPFKNLYGTPTTLGADRICAIAGAHHLFPGEDCMIFDFGTAVTIDFLNKNGEYEGGNISLGLNTRFKAMNHYTNRLPLLTPTCEVLMKGNSTASAIQSGIMLGIMFEVEGYINKYPNHKCLFTGGDSIFFVEKLKNPIFVVFNLVMKGLSLIAEIN